MTKEHFEFARNVSINTIDNEYFNVVDWKNNFAVIYYLWNGECVLIIENVTNTSEEQLENLYWVVKSLIDHQKLNILDYSKLVENNKILQDDPVDWSIDENGNVVLHNEFFYPIGNIESKEDHN